MDWLSEIDKEDWLTLAPSLIGSAVTLLVAFGVWRLSTGAERRRERDRVEREDRDKRAQLYADLYASLHAWPNVARSAFTDPTDRGAVDAYEKAMQVLANDYGRLMMLAPLNLVVEIQAPMTVAIDTLDGVMALRRTDGTVLSVEDASRHPHGAQFLRGKELANDVRSLLLGLARRDLGLPGEWHAINPSTIFTDRPE